MASSSKNSMDKGKDANAAFQFLIDNAHGAVQQLVSIVPNSKHKVVALELLSESINKELAEIKDKDINII